MGWFDRDKDRDPKPVGRWGAAGPPPQLKRCPECRGSGRERIHAVVGGWTTIECTECDGSGKTLSY